MRLITFLFLLIAVASVAVASDLNCDNTSSDFYPTRSLDRSPVLTADTPYVYDMGGTVNFTLTAGSQYAYHKYLLLGSTSGTSPGFTLPCGSVLPLNWDGFTDLVIAYLNSPIFVNFYGVLDGNGNGAAQFNLPAPSGPPHPEIPIWFAYYVKDTPVCPVSNPVQVDVVPEWKHPTSYYDPDDAWYNESDAYDGDSNTAAHCPFTWLVAQWSPWLELRLPKAYYCDAVKFSAWYSLLYCNMVSIQIYHNGTWIAVYSGGFDGHPNENIIPFPGGPTLITKARIRFYGRRTVLQEVEADLFEFMFHIND